jgi:hypothetical protein
MGFIHSEVTPHLYKFRRHRKDSFLAKPKGAPASSECRELFIVYWKIA